MQLPFPTSTPILQITAILQYGALAFGFAMELLFLPLSFSFYYVATAVVGQCTWTTACRRCGNEGQEEGGHTHSQYMLLLAVAIFNKIEPADLRVVYFNRIELTEFWFVFGTRSNLCYTAVHEVVTMMHHRTCASLPIFHALTECDSFSSFTDE